MEEKTILHVDMNAFFASVEQARNPELRGKPVIVCGDPEGRGVVSAASYEARRYGVHSAMPAATARRLCPHGIFIPANIRLYASVSKAIFDMFHDFTPIVEPVSIDEAFLDLSGCDTNGTPIEAARAMKARIRDCFGLTCSIGIAFNRLLAKMASDMQKPDGLVVITKQDIERLIWPLEVQKLVGIGEKTAKRLQELGIVTIGQLARAPAEVLTERFGVYGQSLLRMARGEEDLSAGHDRPKSLSRETTFSSDVADREFIRRELLKLAEDVSARLRAHKLQARTITLKYRFSDFSTFTRSSRLDACADTTEPIFDTCWRLLCDHVPQGKELRLVGISASGLVEAHELRQGVLALDPEAGRHVYTALDLLRNKYGPSVVVRGSMLSREPQTKSRTVASQDSVLTYEVRVREECR